MADRMRGVISRWRRYLRRRLGRRHRYLKRAEAARDRGDWARAAVGFAKAVRLSPDNPSPILVQLGHAYKESGDGDRAVAVYYRAIDSDPGDGETLLHLAALLASQDGDSNEIARLLHRALTIDPGNDEAQQRLAQMGRRDLIPAIAVDRRRMIEKANAIDRLRRELALLLDATAGTLAWPLPLYADFRRAVPVPAPPSVAPSPRIAVIMTRSASPAMLRTTLQSLRHQSLPPHEVLIVGAEHLRDHPVASTCAADRPVRLAKEEDLTDPRRSGSDVVLIEAGVTLDNHAIGWLAYARMRTGLPIAYADHDSLVTDWREGEVHSDPVVFPMHDVEATRAGGPAPIALLVAGEVLGGLLAGGDWLRGLRSIAIRFDRAAHVPLMLASSYQLPRPAAWAPCDPGEALTPVAPAATVIAAAPDHRADHSPARILVVIPTRDHADLVMTMVDSLFRTADRRDRIEAIIVNNRSSHDARTALASFSASRGVTLIDVDEPFNWSRCNNIAVAHSTADVLVFANNDMVMHSPAWDTIVRTELGRESIGACGARLIYPNGRYQHAGVVLGHDRHSLSAHEGIGQHGDEPGPQGRWHRSHQSAAVTGAFLATRRDVFEKLGGFDEQLAVAYNDIDYCLSIRQAGHAVMYVPSLLLTHLESETRGVNRLRHEVAWDESEQATLRNRWHDALRRDPGYSPAWARDGQPFDGLREVPISDVLDWLDQGAAKGWRP